MKIVQYISGKFHYIKYVKFLEAKVDLKFVFSGKPTDSFIKNEVNCWLFYTVLQSLIKVLPSKLFNLSLRVSYLFWKRAVAHEVAKDSGVDVYHFLCHGFTGEILKKYKKPETVLLGHVVNAHPKEQTRLINQSLADSGMVVNVDKSREYVDTRILAEVAMSDYVLSPSQFVTDSYVKNGFPQDKFITLNYGLERILINTDITSARIYNKDETIKVISIGQIIPRKGQHLLVKALLDLESEGYKFELVLVGSSDDDYMSIIQNIGFQFKHISHMKNSELQTYLKSFDLFILPSYEDGFAVAVTEAISSNVPVIVSSAVGAVDLFLQKTHSVFEVGSKLSLISKIRDFINGEYSESVVNAYDWKHYTDLLVSRYSEVKKK